MKTIYRVEIFNNFNTTTCLVSHKCLSQFLDQYRDCPKVKIIGKNGELIVKMEKGVITDCPDSALETILNNELHSFSLTDERRELSLFKFSVRIFEIELFYLYSTDLVQAKAEFDAWSIFEPIEIQQVA